MDKFINLAKVDFNKYENYIRVGHTGYENGYDEYGQIVYECSDLQDFPTPSKLGRKLHDVDKDAYTDLLGYTHRHRVRHDVEDLLLTYNVLSDNDESFILNKISPEWVYIELTDKKTKEKRVHKVYASDKEWDTNFIVKDGDTWYEQSVQFSFSFTEE